MNCQDVQQELDELLDGTLPEPRRGEVRDHLEACEACRREYAGIQRLRAALQAQPAPAPRAGFLRRA
ncbi:MAG: anti-sigma factor family protein, partial [Thiohalospira sp.]